MHANAARGKASSKALRTLVALALLGLTATCSNGNSLPGFIIDLKPQTLTIQQGGLGSVAVSINNNALHPITVNASALPAGVTVSPLTLTPPATTGELLFDVSDTTVPGTYDIRVYANEADAPTQFGSDPMTLVIVPRAGGLTLTFNPAEAAVRQGAVDSTELTVHRTGGFSGAVALSVHPPPFLATLDATQLPKSTTDNTATLTYSVGLVAPGRYLVTVGAVPDGFSEQTAPFFVDVVGPGGQFALVVAESATSIPQGGTGSASVRVVRISPYAEAIAVTVEGLPTGVTATVAPPSIAPANETATIAFTAAPNAPTGTYPVTIRASGPNAPDETATLSLSVLPNAFTVAVNPSVVLALPGGGSTVQVSVNRMGFTDPIDLTSSSADGITGTFTPSTLTNPAVASSFAFTVPAGLANGAYPVTISASSPLAATQRALLTVQVWMEPCGVALATGLNFPEDLRQAGSNLFWRDGAGGIFSMPKVGGAPVPIVPGVQAFGLAVDDAGVYFMLASNETLDRCDPSGQNCQQLVRGGTLPDAGPPVTTQGNLAVDDAYVYWGLAGFPYIDGGFQHETAIYRASKTPGGTVTTLVDDFRAPAGGDTSGVSVLVDDANLYFNDGATVKSAPKAGGAATLLATNGSKSFGLWQDATALYWLVGFNPVSAVGKVDKTGTNAVALDLGINPLLGGLDVDGTSLYAETARLIEKFAKDGGSGVVLVQNTDAAFPFTEVLVDTTSVYWLVNGGTGSFSIWARPK